MTTKLTIKNRHGIIAEWRHGGSAKTSNGSMLTDGGLLWSYGLQIGFTSQSGIRVLGDFTSGGGEYHSQTTSTHVGLAKSVATEVVHPEVFKTMVPELHIPDRREGEG